MPRPISQKPALLVYILFVLSAILPASLRAGGSEENIFLVVNQKSAHSLAIANHYIHLRKIPPSNVIYLDHKEKQEATSVDSVKKNLLTPILNAIKQRGLENQIDYIVYSSGIPTRVHTKPHMDKFLKQTGQKYQAHLHAPWSSLNSITYYYTDVMNDEPVYFNLDSNLYMRKPSPDFMAGPFIGKTQKDYANAARNLKNAKYTMAIKLFARLAKQHPDHAVVQYQYARALGMNGENEHALQVLQQAIQAGWNYKRHTKDDVAFRKIRRDARFVEMVDTIGTDEFGMLPTMGFSNQLSWAQNGWPNNDFNQGKRYMISTVLAMSPIIGSTTTLEDSFRQLERSVAADGTKPSGTFFFAKHKDVRSKTRQSQFSYAITKLQELGYDAKLITSTMPQNEDVLGVTLGSPKLDWKKSGSNFMPGAICDNFTSYGGWLEKRKVQTPVTDFLKYGAAGASGAVYEPYTIPPKFPHSSLHVHYARGATLGEAFYQSISGPFQMLIVGDPLCRPFANLPQFNVSGIEDGATVSSDFTIAATAKPTGPPISRYEIFLDGVKTSSITASSITESGDHTISIRDLTAGYHEIRVVGVEASPIRTRASQRFEFTVEKQNKKVEIRTNASAQPKLSGNIKVQAVATIGNEITIYQNSRIVGKIRGKQGTATIPCAMLGQGKSRLFGVARHSSGVIASTPIEIDIKP